MKYTIIREKGMQGEVFQSNYINAVFNFIFLSWFYDSLSVNKERNGKK